MENPLFVYDPTSHESTCTEFSTFAPCTALLSLAQKKSAIRRPVALCDCVSVKMCELAQAQTKLTSDQNLDILKALMEVLTAWKLWRLLFRARLHDLLSLAKCARKLISESQRSNEMPMNLGQELNYEAGWRSVKQVMPCCMLASGWRFAIVSLLWRRDIVVGAENPRTGKTVAEKAGVTRGDERFESKSSLISTRFSSTWRISWRRRTSVLSFSSKFQKSEMDRNGIFWGHANQ